MGDKTTRIVDPLPSVDLENQGGPVIDRRTLVKGAAVATGLAAGLGAPDYLRGFSFTETARAQSSGPVKLGFIEDESGNLAVYGLQKLHAAQLAVKEINDG